MKHILFVKDVGKSSTVAKCKHIATGPLSEGSSIEFGASQGHVSLVMQVSFGNSSVERTITVHFDMR